MNVIVHYPKTAKGLELLRQKVAEVHAEAAIRHLNKLHCPKEQRLQLHREIKKACRDDR